MNCLIEILRDKSARIDERDDDAMDLDEFDDETVEEALIVVAKNNNEDSLILASCGESLGQIWKRKNYFNKKIYESLSETAKRELAGILDIH